MRRRSFRYVGSLVERLFGFEAGPSSARREILTWREKLHFWPSMEPRLSRGIFFHPWTDSRASLKVSMHGHNFAGLRESVSMPNALGGRVGTHCCLRSEKAGQGGARTFSSPRSIPFTRPFDLVEHRLARAPGCTLQVEVAP